MKKWDKVIIIAVLSAAMLCVLIWLAFGKGGSSVTVTQNNSVVYEGSLFEDKIIELDGNIIEIKNGTAIMQSAECKNQICVNHKAISKKGESIICLPNKVIIEIR